MQADRIALRSSRTPKARLFPALILVAASVLAAMPRTATADDVPFFYVVNSGTLMMAEVVARRTDDGAPVVLWPNYGGPSQQFSIQRLPRSDAEPLQEQWFLLRARHSGKCMKTNGFQPGAAIVQETCSGDASQLWRLRPVVMTAAECRASGQCFMGRRTVLENYHDRGRRCLDAANVQLSVAPAQGETLHARDCVTKFSASNAVNQEWELVDVQNWDAPFNFR
jgi:hypothetical protein